jgi:hypothetical protein
MEKYIPSTIPINLLEMDYISQPTESRDWAESLIGELLAWSNETYGSTKDTRCIQKQRVQTTMTTLWSWWSLRVSLH